MAGAAGAHGRSRPLSCGLLPARANGECSFSPRSKAPYHLQQVSSCLLYARFVFLQLTTAQSPAGRSQRRSGRPSEDGLDYIPAKALTAALGEEPSGREEGPPPPRPPKSSALRESNTTGNSPALPPREAKPTANPHWFVAACRVVGISAAVEFLW